MGDSVDRRGRYSPSRCMRRISPAVSCQNTLEDLYNLMLADGTSSFDVADSTRIGQLGLQQNRDAWIGALAGSNDDAGVSRPVYNIISLYAADSRGALLVVDRPRLVEDWRLQARPRPELHSVLGAYLRCIARCEARLGC